MEKKGMPKSATLFTGDLIQSAKRERYRLEGQKHQNEYLQGEHKFQLFHNQDRKDEFRIMTGSEAVERNKAFVIEFTDEVKRIYPAYMNSPLKKWVLVRKFVNDPSKRKQGIRISYPCSEPKKERGFGVNRIKKSEMIRRTTEMTEVGKFLEELLEKREMDKIKLTKAMGVQHAYLYRVMNGKVKVTLERLDQIKKVLKLSREEYLRLLSLIIDETPGLRALLSEVSDLAALGIEKNTANPKG